MNILVPMAGDGHLFEEAGFAFPKNLVEIAGLPLVERVLDQLQPLISAGADLVCLVKDAENSKFHTADVIRLLYPKATVVTVPVLESGAACTALLAIEHLDPEEPLLVFNGDQIVKRDLAPIVADFEERGLDAGVVVFRAVHPRWSYVKLGDDGLVIEAAEKRPISTHATAGMYWYRRASDFLSAVMEMIRKDAHVEGRFYICPAFNELILQGGSVGVSEIPRDDYLSLANPQGVHQYEEELMTKRNGPSDR
jgi:dTDP-glucose pyrophosphorylase